MKKDRSIVGLAILALTQAVARWGARKAGVPWGDPVRWQGTAWCAKPDGRAFSGTPMHMILFPRRHGMLYHEHRVALVRMGAIVAASEWAPDGGGRTWVFRASDEVKGATAEEMWQRQDAARRSS